MNLLKKYSTKYKAFTEKFFLVKKKKSIYLHFKFARKLH